MVEVRGGGRLEEHEGSVLAVARVGRRIDRGEDGDAEPGAAEAELQPGARTSAGNEPFGRGPRAARQVSTRDFVLAGHGTVTATVAGQPARTVQVSGTPNEHAVLTSPSQHTGQLTLRLSPGLEAYDLTFG
jgi:hypothetical protein